MVRAVGAETRNVNFVETGIIDACVAAEIRIEHLPDARLERCRYTKSRLRKGSKLKTRLGSKFYHSLNESRGHRTTRYVGYCISGPK
jgi:hypothetical protein